MTNFVRAYVESALWSSTDDDGQPLDSAKYADLELAPETIARFEQDCAKFQTDYTRALAQYTESQLDISAAEVACLDYSESQIAHDFWLTRNGHGAGFWDGDYPKELGEALTKLSKTYGECNLYIGDDGQLYAM